MLAAFSGKRNVTVRRPSVCSDVILIVAHYGAACEAASIYFGPTAMRTDMLVISCLLSDGAGARAAWEAVAACRLAVLRGAGQFAGGAHLRRRFGCLYPHLHHQLLHRDAACVRPTSLCQRLLRRRIDFPRTTELPRSVLRRGNGRSYCDLFHVTLSQYYVYHGVCSRISLLTTVIHCHKNVCFVYNGVRLLYAVTVDNVDSNVWVELSSTGLRSHD